LSLGAARAARALAIAREAIEGENSPATRRDYERDLAHFLRWFARVRGGAAAPSGAGALVPAAAALLEVRRLDVVAYVRAFSSSRHPRGLRLTLRGGERLAAGRFRFPLPEGAGEAAPRLVEGRWVTLRRGARHDAARLDAFDGASLTISCAGEAFGLAPTIPRADLLLALAARTMGRRLAVLARVFAELRAAGLVESDPLRGVKRPRVGRDGTTPACTERDAAALFAALPPWGTDLAGDRDRLLLAFLFALGLRAGEAGRLATADFLPGRPEVLQVTVKGGRVRNLPLPPLISRWKAEYVTRYAIAGPLFPSLSRNASRGRPFDGAAVGRIFAQRAAAAGLPPCYTPHSARAAAITRWILEGADFDAVQDAAGHRSPETTMRYHRARRRIERSPILKVAVPFGGEGE
jgi:integrase